MAKKHTRDDRYKAAVSLLATRNSEAVSRETRIPGSTIRHWAQNDEDFQLICQELQAEFGESIKQKYAEIINESADQASDRLRNGDFIRDTRTGELVRVPIKGKEAAIIGAIAFDKLRLIENQPTKIVQNDSEEPLKRLNDKLRAIAEADQRGNKVEAVRLVQELGGTATPGLKKDRDA